MTTQEVNSLLQVGAKGKVRQYIKKLGIPQRMQFLAGCIPLVKQSQSNLKFFKENFSVEIGAILTAEGDVSKATELYRTAKDLKKGR
jgi:hypothetical protein